MALWMLGSAPLWAQATLPPPAPEENEDVDAPQDEPRDRGTRAALAAETEAVEQLTTQARESSEKQRRAAVRMLVEVVPALEGADRRALERAAVKDASVQVRFLAVRALERRQEGGPALATALQVDPDARVRQAAARALGRLGAQGTAQETALLAALEDPSTEVVLAATRALQAVGSPGALETMRKLGSRKEAVADALEAARLRMKERHRTERRREAFQRDLPRFREEPSLSAPLMRRAWGMGGTGVLVTEGALGGMLMGALVPVAVGGAQGTPFTPVTAGVGAVAGMAVTLGFAGLRRLNVPVLDALLVGVHAASGMAAGMGYGFFLGSRGSPQVTAGMGILGGGVTALVSLGVSPWLRTRPAVVMGAASGGVWGGLTGILGAGMLGRNLVNNPSETAAYALLGQGLGVVLGTVLPAGTGISAADVAMVDTFGLMGTGVASVGALFLLARVPGGASAALSNGIILAGAVTGSAAGLLLSTFLPPGLESRLEAGLAGDGWPVRLKPGTPVPTLNPLTGKPNGAVLPFLSGSWK